jgi:hypothetical protein
LTAALSGVIGLPMTMALGAPLFVVAMLIWTRLPETLARKTS